MKKNLTAVLCLFFVYSADALSAPTLGVGAVAQNMMKVSTSAKAERGLTGATYLPELSIGWHLGSWYPSIGYTLIAKKSPEGGQKKTLITLAFPLTFGADVEWKLGPALQIYRIKGSGGTSEQNNGSSTATFYLPNGSKSSRTLYLDLGAGFTAKNLRFDLDFFTTGILSQRFSVTGIARFSYVFL